MKIQYITKCFFLSALVFSSQIIVAQSRINTLHSKLSHSYDIEGSLNLLNFCGEQPESLQHIYKTAFETLSLSPQNSYSDLALNNTFIQLCEENGIILTGGPMLGNISSDGVNIWVRTLTPANVKVQVNNNGENIDFDPVYSSKESDMTAVVTVSGLKTNTKYFYQVFINGKPVNDNRQFCLTTTSKVGQPTKTNIVFGSCYHRWGLCNPKLADQIKSTKPSALLLMGDIAAQDRQNNIALHRADYLLRDFQVAWKEMVANLPVYATWDDHDYFDNDKFNVPKGFTKKDKEAVCEVFRTSWNNPPYGNKKEGVYFRTRIGPADVIMLDNRYFRKKGNFLGEEQMKWLEEQLLDCKGPFIILSNGTMWSDYVSGGKDSWGVFDPKDREKIFRLIEKNRIGGVLLISGDRHGARGFKIPRPSGYNFYEFGAASLGGRVGPPPIRADWDNQLYGISGEYAFGEFSFDTTLSDPEVTFRLIHEDGTVLYKIALTRNQLTPN